MAFPPHTETGAVVAQVPPPVEHGAEQEMPPMGLSKVAPALGEPSAGRAPPADFSEAIDRIGLGPFQTRIVIMCGMVRALVDVYLHIGKFCCVAIVSLTHTPLLGVGCSSICGVTPISLYCCVHILCSVSYSLDYMK